MGRYDSPVAEVLPVARCPFYNITVPCPRNTTAWLVRYFGHDFMRPRRRYGERVQVESEGQPTQPQLHDAVTAPAPITDSFEELWLNMRDVVDEFQPSRGAAR